MYLTAQLDQMGAIFKNDEDAQTRLRDLADPIERLYEDLSGKGLSIEMIEAGVRMAIDGALAAKRWEITIRELDE